MYIDLEFVVGINIAICEECNVKSIMINENNILSALSAQQWYDNKHELASALLRSLIIGHRFQDGNKRTAVVVANSIAEFECSEQEAEKCIIEIATGNIKDVLQIASILYCKSY